MVEVEENKSLSTKNPSIEDDISKLLERSHKVVNRLILFKISVIVGLAIIFTYGILFQVGFSIIVALWGPGSDPFVQYFKLSSDVFLILLLGIVITIPLTYFFHVKKGDSYIDTNEPIKRLFYWKSQLNKYQRHNYEIDGVVPNALSITIQIWQDIKNSYTKLETLLFIMIYPQITVFLSFQLYVELCSENIFLFQSIRPIAFLICLILALIFMGYWLSLGTQYFCLKRKVDLIYKATQEFYRGLD